MLVQDLFIPLLRQSEELQWLKVFLSLGSLGQHLWRHFSGGSWHWVAWFDEGCQCVFTCCCSNDGTQLGTGLTIPLCQLSFGGDDLPRG